MTPLLEHEVCEVGYVLCLTSKLDLIGYHEVSRGSLDSTLMHPREVFKAAVLLNAAGVVLVHNHPSGNPSPSADDIALTARIQEAGKLMGIELLDHVIIGHEGRWVSLREEGRL
jgi:DNA repair protein RadC